MRAITWVTRSEKKQRCEEILRQRKYHDERRVFSLGEISHGEREAEGADIEGHLQGLTSGSRETNLEIQHSGLVAHLLLQ